MHMTGVMISMTEYAGPPPQNEVRPHFLRRWWRRIFAPTTSGVDPTPYLTARDRDDLVLLTTALRERQKRLDRQAIAKAQQKGRRGRS